MIKTLVFAYLLSQSSLTPAFVTEFHTLNNRQEEERFIKTYTDSSVDANAYVLALEMKKAEYYILPWRKWTIFQTQKKRLDQLINLYPQNIHLRYIRLVLQERTPAFLGYNKHIEEDKSFLQIKLDQEDSTDYMDLYITQNTSL